MTPPAPFTLQRHRHHLAPPAGPRQCRSPSSATAITPPRLRDHASAVHPPAPPPSPRPACGERSARLRAGRGGPPTARAAPHPIGNAGPRHERHALSSERQCPPEAREVKNCCTNRPPRLRTPSPPLPPRRRGDLSPQAGRGVSEPVASISPAAFANALPPLPPRRRGDLSPQAGRGVSEPVASISPATFANALPPSPRRADAATSPRKRGEVSPSRSLQSRAPCLLTPSPPLPPRRRGDLSPQAGRGVSEPVASISPATFAKPSPPLPPRRRDLSPQAGRGVSEPVASISRAADVRHSPAPRVRHSPAPRPTLSDVRSAIPRPACGERSPRLRGGRGGAPRPVWPPPTRAAPARPQYE